MLYRIATRLLIRPSPVRLILRTYLPLVAVRRVCPCCGGLGYLELQPDPAELVAAIADHIGDRNFTTHEMINHAALVGGSLEAALRGANAKKIGKLFTCHRGYCDCEIIMNVICRSIH